MANRIYEFTVTVQIPVPEEYLCEHNGFYREPDDNTELEFCCADNQAGGCDNSCDHYFWERLRHWLTRRSPQDDISEEQRELDRQTELCSTSIERRKDLEE